MDGISAKTLLESLIGRIERDPSTKRYRLQGALSDLEYAALEYALAGLNKPRAINDVSPPAVGTSIASSEALNSQLLSSNSAASTGAIGNQQQPSPTSSKAAVAPPPKLIIDAQRNKVEDAEITLCLDFGTAKSKAFATRRNTSGFQLIELGLGQQAGEVLPYPLTSAVWVDESGLLFVGHAALERSFAQHDTERKRLDSLKQQLSQGSEHRLTTRLKEGTENPTSIPLTYGDALTFYLAYLTDMAEAELVRQGHSRYVRRRFALPCWDTDQSRIMEPLLREYLARAQIVADTFRGQWSEGLRAEHVRAVMDQVVEARAAWPMSLIGESVLEPIAAGNSRLQTDEPTRQLVLVIDIGAGTTDFGLFIVVENPDQELFRITPIEGTMLGVRQAGDTVDQILRTTIIKQAEVDANDPSFGLINSQLQLRIREYKERLFQEGSLTFRLSDDRTGIVRLDSLLQSQALGAFREKLEAKCREVLDAAGKDKAGFYDAELRVVLTGGGSTLPMLETLAKGSSEHFGKTLRRRMAPPIPDFLQNRPIAGAYAQLAVALGGALPDLPDTRRPVTTIKGSAVRTVKMPNSWV
ncbi:hypothetical protein ACIHQR_22140 [Corallococcus coralloides]|uniref:hypothetical protein n=1 Tax=Corallococcus coralloides TaxID=184914 RepID=UPI00384B9162